MATLLHYLMLMQNVHVVVRKELVKTPVLRRSSVRSVTVFLKIRRKSWQHLHTGHVRSSRRRQALPKLCYEGEVSDLKSTSPDQEEMLDVDQDLSAEQTYRETMRGVRSFIAWADIPEFDFSSSSQNDNPFKVSRTSHTGKVSVKVPVDEWLCRKCEKLNITVQEGYSSHTSETAGLSRDQFVKPPKMLKWYGMHCEKKDFSHSKVYT